LTLFYKTVAASESSVSIADSGNHQTAIILEFSGVDTAAPIAATAGQTNATNATVTFPTVTSTHANQMIVLCMANDRDLASTTNLSA